MHEARVIAIDPAPAKPSTVFDGVRYARMPAPELRDYVNAIASEGFGTLVCSDAPLTGPTDLDRAGSVPYDFTKRVIERFFSLEATGSKGHFRARLRRLSALDDHPVGAGTAEGRGFRCARVRAAIQPGDATGSPRPAPS